MRLPILPFVFGVSVMGVGTAHAQAAPPEYSVFIASHIGPHWDDVYSDYLHVPGHVREIGVSFGVESPKAGIEVDVSVSNWHVKTVGRSRSLLTSRQRSSEVGISFRRNLHLDEAVTLTWLVGAASVYRPHEFVSVTNEAPSRERPPTTMLPASPGSRWR